MSTLTTTTVQCDRLGCGEWEPRAETTSGLKNARRNAAVFGWTLRRVDGHDRDLCPACSPMRDPEFVVLAFLVEQPAEPPRRTGLRRSTTRRTGVRGRGLHLQATRR
ncbi:hypothetical protein [Saccharothrix sp. HUAS TT1]|uniref:hypothetical protein n=1 Tax=unclassified Saccharothrix TaxID=2593673 RepID=UPI00345BAB65